MTGALKQVCTDCGGKGTVARERRKLENGEPDPSDFRGEDICLLCGGSGKVPLDKTRLVEKGAGWLADHIG